MATSKEATIPNVAPTPITFDTQSQPSDPLNADENGASVSICQFIFLFRVKYLNNDSIIRLLLFRSLNYKKKINLVIKHKNYNYFHHRHLITNGVNYDMAIYVT